MRRLLTIFFLALLAFFLGALWFPVQMKLEDKILIFSNESIVIEEIMSLERLKKILEQEKRKVEIENGTLFWKEGNTAFKAVCNGQFWQFKSLDLKSYYKAAFRVSARGIKKTEVQLFFESSKTINPFLRYSYFLHDTLIARRIKNYLELLKKDCENQPFEPFKLTDFSLQDKEEFVLSIRKTTSEKSLSILKNFQIPEYIYGRLLKYQALDTLKNPYLQYIKWEEAKVCYELCIPLAKPLSKRQQFYFSKWKQKKIKGHYYTAIYSGEEGFFAKGWDSLYSIFQKQNHSPKGFPLEELLSKNQKQKRVKLWISF